MFCCPYFLPQPGSVRDWQRLLKVYHYIQKWYFLFWAGVIVMNQTFKLNQNSLIILIIFYDHYTS